MGEEKARTLIVQDEPQGSPPRRRGKATFSGRSDPGVGITPAQAGKRDSATVAAALSRDHPRVGGEKVPSQSWATRPPGSPPHGRGKDSFIVHCHACVGITPAWAGKSPELRGYDGKVVGSPPHGRGKGQLSVGHQIRERITPAWAGKRAARGESSSSSWDHPRIGGEKYTFERVVMHRGGSPPRWRGKDHNFRCR